MKSSIRRVAYVSIAAITALLLAACAVVLPALGRDPEGMRLEAVERSPHYRDGQFRNQIETPMLTKPIDVAMALIKGRTEPKVRPAPTMPLPTVKVDLRALPADRDLVIWLGHSGYYVQLGGRRMLIDPVLGSRASPIPGMSTAFAGTDLYTADEMPDLDYILISHDHYDHLDRETVRALEPRTRHVVAGLGTGGHFERWGWPREKLHEADWNAALTLDAGLTVHVLPARHYSGRTLARNKTLWVSFALETPQRRLFFSGDSGFGPHFAEIGRRFGGFDLVMLDMGQYNVRWAPIHMNPEEAAQAAGLLHAKALLPAHVLRFSLARHPWDEPLERIEAASHGKPYRLLTPRIGDPVYLADSGQSFAAWWKGIE